MVAPSAVAAVVAANAAAAAMLRLTTVSVTGRDDTCTTATGRGLTPSNGATGAGGVRRRATSFGK